MINALPLFFCRDLIFSAIGVMSRCVSISLAPPHSSAYVTAHHHPRYLSLQQEIYRTVIVPAGGGHGGAECGWNRAIARKSRLVVSIRAVASRGSGRAFRLCALKLRRIPPCTRLTTSIEDLINSYAAYRITCWRWISPASALAGSIAAMRFSRIHRDTNSSCRRQRRSHS